MALDLDNLDAEIAILGVPSGLPYVVDGLANDQSRAPDAIRKHVQDAAWEKPCTRVHFGWDLGGPLLDNRPIKVVDCGNVTADKFDPYEHYRQAEVATGKIFQSDATLITLGGDHSIPIPILRALPKNEKVTLVQVDAHMDWRHGQDRPAGRWERANRGCRSREISWRDPFSAYEMHDIGMDAVLDQIPGGGPYYLTVDADGLDPTIMPAVNAPTPGGLTWIQTHKLIHGLV